MADNFTVIYYSGMSPEKLAEKVISISYGEMLMPPIPIDPFKLMRKFGIIYQFMEFRDLEGIYIVPEDENDVPIVGINYTRKITRQRFTAAHELCHHLKDRKSETCPIGGKSELERYAEMFAAELLMPRHLFRSVTSEYVKDGKVTLDDALQIAERFGVSFWYRFKNEFIYNENRMEGLNLDEDEVAEIITDLRMNGQDSDYCKEDYDDIIQVVGHTDMYDYVLATDMEVRNKSQEIRNDDLISVLKYKLATNTYLQMQIISKKGNDYEHI